MLPPAYQEPSGMRYSHNPYHLSGPPGAILRQFSTVRRSDGTTGEATDVNQRVLGVVNVVQQRGAVEEVHGILQNTPVGLLLPRGGGSIPVHNQDVLPNSPSLHTVLPQHIHKDGVENGQARRDGQRTGEAGSPNTHKAGKSNDSPGSSDDSKGRAGRAAQDGCHDHVEDGITVGRGIKDDKRQFHPPGPTGDHRVLGVRDEVNVQGPILTNDPDSNHRAVHGGDLQVFDLTEEDNKGTAVIPGVQCVLQNAPVTLSRKVRSAQLQEGGERHPPHGGNVRKVHPSTSNVASKAQGGNIAKIDNIPILLRQGKSSAVPRHTGRNPLTVDQEFERLLFQSLTDPIDSAWLLEDEADREAHRPNKHSITRRPAASKIPATPEEKRSPLHAKKVKGLSIENVRKRLNERTRKRFDELWMLLVKGTPGEFSEDQLSHSNLLKGDIETLFEADIIRKVTSDMLPSTGTVHPFTVVETKEGGLRRRFIAWTKALNEHLKSSYIPDVPLKHVSEYTGNVKNEEGGLRDLKISFHQVVLPESVSAHFRFKDEEGQVWELTRLPMGFVASPEIMQIITSCIAGDISTNKPEFCTKLVTTDVWIDNIRVTGKKAAVTQALQTIDANAAAIGATFNVDESKQGKQYEFIGIQFDHTSQKVKLASKPLARLVEFERLYQNSFADITCGQLEQLIGRLLFASTVLDIRTSSFWWALKATRRCLSLLSRGRISVHDPAKLPQSAVGQLKVWFRTAKANIPRSIHVYKNNGHVLFTDASGYGWGAVLVMKNGPVHVTGAKWENEWHDINQAECRAVVLALEAFHHHLEKGSRTKVFVDNTSTMHTIKKGSSKALLLNEEVDRVRSLLKDKGISIDISYIATNDNPADVPSREPFEDSSEEVNNKLARWEGQSSVELTS